MNRFILKFFIDSTGINDIEVPKGFKFLSVQAQDSRLVMWGICPYPSDGIEIISILVLATGQPYNNRPMKYLATVQMKQYVWHVFRVYGSPG